jgi:hypothetical protein
LRTDTEQGRIPQSQKNDPGYQKYKKGTFDACECVLVAEFRRTALTHIYDTYLASFAIIAYLAPALLTLKAKERRT